MAENTEFAHGYAYDDYLGTLLTGPRCVHDQTARLVVDSGYIWTLFLSLSGKARKAGDGIVPQLVTEWNTHELCAQDAPAREITEQAALELARALKVLTEPELLLRDTTEARNKVIRCARCIATFICERIDRGHSLFIEDDCEAD
jgi:hypothetical protein